MKVLCMHCIVSPLASYNEAFLLSSYENIWNNMDENVAYNWDQSCFDEDLNNTGPNFHKYIHMGPWWHDATIRKLKQKTFLAIFACWMKSKKGSNILNEWMQVLHLVNQMWLK
jgi:hypothetical protein